MTAKAKRIRRSPTSMPIARRVLCGILLVLILLNMILIFSFSVEDSEKSGQRSEGVTQAIVSVVVKDFDKLTEPEQNAKVEKFHPSIRKLAHLSEFALLGFLCGAFLFALGKGKYWMYWAFPAAFGLLYAISDEVHQIFTNRGPAVTDVLIDFTGNLLGLCFIHLCVCVTKKIIAKRKAKRLCEQPDTV